ncbi:MAG: hypothetical protein IPK13_21265 [Deltaproteobacteria bacterium]|nr:hypothetical protein [Deltaproteobacteria bacterium]
MTAHDKDSTDVARSARTVGDVQRVLSRVSPELSLNERVLLSVSTLFETERPGPSGLGFDLDLDLEVAPRPAPRSDATAIVRPRNLLDDLLMPDPAFDETDG